MGQCLGIRKGSNDNVIEKLSRNGKTYFNITNYEKLHDLFGHHCAKCNE
jgi:hypothetical protein